MAHPVQTEVKVENSLIRVRELKSGTGFIQIDHKTDGDGVVIITPSNIHLRPDYVRGVYELESSVFAGHKASFTISEELMTKVRRLYDHLRAFDFANDDAPNSIVFTIFYQGAVVTAVDIDRRSALNYLITDLKAEYATEIAHVDPPAEADSSSSE